MSYRSLLTLLFIVYQSVAMNKTEHMANKAIINATKMIHPNVISNTPKSITIPLRKSGSPTKIIGGTGCGVERYPFVVSLRRSSSLSHFCAGTLIRPDWVLTAARCIAVHVSEPKLFTVIAGISQVNQLGIQRIRVKEMFIHPDFDEINYDNDIALISLEHKFVITELVKPIDIPINVIQEDILAICPEATAVGWGWHNDTKKHKENGSIPHVPVMQCVLNLPVLSDVQCQNARTGLHLRPNTFCTMVPTKDNLCQGDSGGPLFCDNMQFGIISSGFTCNEPDDTPGYYTRVDRVLNFIKECMAGRVSYATHLRMEEREYENAALTIKHNLLYVLLSLFSCCVVGLVN